MRTASLLQILETLDKKDRRLLRQWLGSPFFNLRDDVMTLYLYIEQGLGKDPAMLTKARAFAAVYPARPYSEAQMNHLMSWLLTQVRDYLAWREWQSDPAAVSLHRCRALRKLGLEASFEQAWTQAEQTLEEQAWRDEQWHQLRHQLFREKYEYQSLQRRLAEVPLDQMAYHAETAWQLNRLRYECSAEVMRAVANRGSSPAVEQPDETVLLYRQLLQALRQPDDEAAFFSAQALLELYWMRFREGERRDLYLLALNYCIRKINEGQRQFMRAAFDLYRAGLSNRALFENGLVSRFTYKNAVTAGLALQEFDWVRQFIEDFKTFLPPRERHGAYTYNLAVYYFRRPDYDQAMLLLRNADFGDDVLTNLDARSMLLRIYFEQGYQDALESLLDSFQTYLRRQKSIGYQRDNYLNLIRFVRKLLKTDAKDLGARAALRHDVENTPALAERAWVLWVIGGK